MEISFKTDSNNKVSNSKVSNSNVDDEEALLMMEMVKVPSALNKG